MKTSQQKKLDSLAYRKKLIAEGKKFNYYDHMTKYKGKYISKNYLRELRLKRRNARLQKTAFLREARLRKETEKAKKKYAKRIAHQKEHR